MKPARARRELPRLRVRQPRKRWPFIERLSGQSHRGVRRHVRPRARGRGRGGAELLPRHPALQLEALPGEPDRRAAPFGGAPVDRPRRARSGEGDREEGKERRGSFVPHALGLRDGDHRQVGQLPDHQLPVRPLRPRRLHGPAAAGPRHARLRQDHDQGVRPEALRGDRRRQHPPRAGLSGPVGAVAAAAAARSAARSASTARSPRSGTSA